MTSSRTAGSTVSDVDKIFAGVSIVDLRAAPRDRCSAWRTLTFRCTDAVGLVVAHGFKKLNLHKVTDSIWTTSVRSRKILEKTAWCERVQCKKYFGTAG